MYRFLSPSIALGTLLLCSRAMAQGNIYSCCDIGSANGACVSQQSPCDLGTWGAELSLYWATFRSDGWELDGSYPFPFEPTCNDPQPRKPGDNCNAGWQYGVPPEVYDTSFPSGSNGYLVLSSAPSPAWVGLCLDAPSATDPAHAGPTEPLVCMTFSLSPGVSAQAACYQFPVDSRWDAVQLCYGPQSGGRCADLNDQNDPTVSATPASGSCCGPPRKLRTEDLVTNTEWQVAIAQEIPGVPEPELYYGLDGGLVLNPLDGGIVGSVPDDACLSQLNEPSNCGLVPAAGGASEFLPAAP